MTDAKLKILTKDGVTVEIERKYASYSELVKGFIENLDEDQDQEIPINV